MCFPFLPSNLHVTHYSRIETIAGVESWPNRATWALLVFALPIVLFAMLYGVHCLLSQHCRLNVLKFRLVIEHDMGFSVPVFSFKNPMFIIHDDHR